MHIRASRFAMIFATLIQAACTANPGPVFEITVADDEAAWIHAITDSAIEFWLDHGVVFVSTDTGRLTVSEKVLPNDRIAECECNFWLDGGQEMHGYVSGSIHIQPFLSTWHDSDFHKRGCVVAHEMGHALGMRHVAQGPSMLAPVLVFEEEGKCNWSDLDQAELCRAQPRLCK